MSVYKIKVNINDTLEQDVFILFQCSVLSALIVDNENISFKSQAIVLIEKFVLKLLLRVFLYI